MAFPINRLLPQRHPPPGKTATHLTADAVTMGEPVEDSRLTLMPWGMGFKLRIRWAWDVASA